MEDRDLLAMLEARDEKVLTALFEKYGHYCGAIAFNVLKNRLDSEECVNDAILRLWNAPPKSAESLQSYLASLVRNLAYDRYKEAKTLKRGGTVRVEALEDLSELASSTVDVEEEVAKKELSRALNRFLRQLSEKERRVFIRRFYFLDDAAAIARSYGTSRWAVLKMLSRTKKKLQSFLESEGFK